MSKRSDAIDRLLRSTKSRDIGVQYLGISTIVGLAFAYFLISNVLEILEPGVQFMCRDNPDMSGCSPSGYIAGILSSAQGLKILAIIFVPAIIGGLGNYLAKGEPKFPLINKISMWIYTSGAILTVISVFTTQPTRSANLSSLAFYIVIAAIIFATVRFITTFLSSRNQNTPSNSP